MLALLEGVQLHGTSWAQVAQHVGSKSQARPDTYDVHARLRYAVIPLAGLWLHPLMHPGALSSSGHRLAAVCTPCIEALLCLVMQAGWTSDPEL